MTNSTMKSARDRSHDASHAGRTQAAAATAPGKRTLVEAISPAPAVANPAVQRTPARSAADGTLRDGDGPEPGSHDELGEDKSDPNFTVLQNGFDPMIPQAVVDSSGGDAEKIVSYFAGILDAFYRDKATREPGTAQADDQQRQQREADVATRFGADVQNETTIAHSPSPVLTASKKWNDRIRGKAIDQVVTDYQNVPVQLPGGLTVHFLTPYNINQPGTVEADGPNAGRNSPTDMSIQAKILIDLGLLPGVLVNMKVIAKKPEKGTDLGKFYQALNTTAPTQLSAAITHLCRMHNVGVDCAGLAHFALGQAAEKLGGQEWSPENVTATGTDATRYTSEPISRPLDWSEFDQLAPGDLLRFVPDGHHIAIITTVEHQAHNVAKLGIAHSNEIKFHELDNGVFSGVVTIDISSAADDDAKKKAVENGLAPIPKIMGPTSHFGGFHRPQLDQSPLYGKPRAPNDRKVGNQAFA